ncbi:hypothetical protein PybrP1_008163 [[Pythium] brassicae (nom. inval.)]|nr:hypothetical protein PybrP1_008163 [[Pythium] brassicae (nom. inval.)]
MGKAAAAAAAASPAKKSGKAAATGASDDTPLPAAERVEQRLESTAVNRESATHLAFATSRKDEFVFAPSPQYVHLLNDYCRWDGSASHSRVLAVVSQPGNGKSALLAHWAAARRQSNDGAHELIYEHYAGCSYDSVRLSLFLFRFMNQIKATYALRDFELPREHEEEKLKFSFGRCLEAAVGRTTHLTGTNAKFKRIILVLDGIDCIRNEDGGDSLSWLPTAFPSNVRIVVSATQTSERGMNHLRCCKWVHRKPFVFDDDGDLIYDSSLPVHDHDSHTIRELRRRHSSFVVVEPLDEPSCRAILLLYEDKFARVVDRDEREAIVAAPGSSSPLYVRLLLHALELFEPAQDEPRKLWLKAASQTSELHVVYEMLMRQWNEILLADLFEQYHKHRAAADAASSLANVAATHSSTGGDGAERKLMRKATKRDVTGEPQSTCTSALNPAALIGHSLGPPELAETEALQTAIEQRALLVRHTLSLLAVSRYGLSDADLGKLFGDAVPKAVAQQLLRLLRPHLMQIRRYDCGPKAVAASTNDAAVLLNDLSHNQFRLIVRYGFLRDDSLRNCYYRELATYFQGMDACQRRVDELPVQLERCALWTSLQSELVDIKMFQLWWSERNRQELFSYWMVLRTNSSLHDPVDDFVRSLDEFVARESPTADQLLALFLTVTDFLRAWQRIDDLKSGHLAINRPEPPQLHEFITGLGNFSTSHLSETDARKIQQDIQALCIHTDDGYFVRRWLWTQFPLIAVAFESRFLRNVLASRFPGGAGGTDGQPIRSDDNQQQLAESASPTPSDSALHAVSSVGGIKSSVVLPKPEKAKAASPVVKRKAVHARTTLPSTFGGGNGASASPSFDEDDFGAFEFLSPENAEISVGSVSKLESQLMELRMRYDKLKFTTKEKSEALQALESRLLDTKAHAVAAGQSSSKMDELLEHIRVANDETLVGRQRSDYYKCILRHCEVNPARDPNTIESAETVVNRLKQDVVELQQRAQVVAYEKRLASIEVPKLQQVLQDKASIHQAALARLRWRQELNHRMASHFVAGRLSSFAAGASESPPGKLLAKPLSASKRQSLGAAPVSAAEFGVSETPTVAGGGGRRTTSTEELSFLRAKDKMVHKTETTAERQKQVESLRQYVGSAFKDDGILGTLRRVGINKPEEAEGYWQDQLDHAAQLAAEEKLGEQRVAELRDKLAALQGHFVNLKLGGSRASSESPPPAPPAAPPGVSAASLSLSSAAVALVGTATGGPTGAGSATTTVGGVESVSKALGLKVVEQQLADAAASNQQKKERAARLKALSEKLQLGLLHVAQIVGVAAAQRMDALALGDAIEQVVRLFLGDESHMQSSSSMNLRRKNSARVMGLAGQAGAHPLASPDARSADDKIRYNVRVPKSPARVMNPYADVAAALSDDDNDDENDAESDDDSDDAERRQDIKTRAKMELHRKEAEKKRAEKKRR